MYTNRTLVFTDFELPFAWGRLLLAAFFFLLFFFFVVIVFLSAENSSLFPWLPCASSFDLSRSWDTWGRCWLWRSLQVRRAARREDFARANEDCQSMAGWWFFRFVWGLFWFGRFILSCPPLQVWNRTTNCGPSRQSKRTTQHLVFAWSYEYIHTYTVGLDSWSTITNELESELDVNLVLALSTKALESKRRESDKQSPPSGDSSDWWNTLRGFENSACSLMFTMLQLVAYVHKQYQ